jgi:8-hydroxy-5-deazaflavin:NADPH oxidoreductase
MKIGILGSGDVAKAMAEGFLQHGHEIKLGTRTSDKLADWAKKNPKAGIASVSEAAKFGELVVLAVKGTAAAEVLRAASAGNLAGKTVMDATSPIADAPPSNGVLSFFYEPRRIPDGTTPTGVQGSPFCQSVQFGWQRLHGQSAF